MVAVPIAASNGDAATVSTTFTLVNGGFARVFPLAPSPATTVTNPTTHALEQLEPGPAYAAMLKRGITVGLIELATFFVIFTLVIAMRFGW